MDVETSGEICDNRPILPHSAVSQRSIEIQIQPAQDIPLKPMQSADTDALRKSLKLELASPSSVESTKNSTTPDNESADGEAASSDDDENAKNNNEIRSPMSPRSPGAQGSRYGSRIIPHQNSLTSTIDVVDDRKALRDALYQGIFSRHRRTIFAMGSFLRMLKSKNSQYNAIRSTSEGEGEDDTR